MTSEATGESAHRLQASASRAQAWVWLGFAILYGAFDIGRQADPRYVELIVRALAWASLGACLTALWYLLLGKLRLVRRSRFAQIAISSLGSVGGGLLWLVCFHQLDFILKLEDGWEPMVLWHRGQLVAEWMDYALVLAVWHGILLAFQQSQQASIARELALHSQALATQMRLETLQAQLRPHFLFNAINAAMALIPEDPARAERVLQQLADLLRSSLRQQNRIVSVQEEVTLVGIYLDIEKTRYEAKLEVEVDVSPSALRSEMPSGLLLPLVDNAVKHGMPQAERAPMRLRVQGRVDEGTLCLSVFNSGSILSQAHPDSLGIGLRNLRQSLAARFGDRARLELVSDEGVWAHVHIPRTATTGPNDD